MRDQDDVKRRGCCHVLSLSMIITVYTVLRTFVGCHGKWLVRRILRPNSAVRRADALDSTRRSPIPLQALWHKGPLHPCLLSTTPSSTGKTYTTGPSDCKCPPHASDTLIMGDHSMKIGQTVLSQDGRQGVVRFVGNASFAKGEWIGLELPDNNGKNDGSVNGERYFRCQPGFGIFVRPESIVEVLSQPPLFTNGKVGVQSTSGVSTKARPSSGITADTARKRQSLMGSNSTSTSRLSIRVSLPICLSA